MSKNEATDAIIERLKKLLALAERGGTEAEADSAMNKVQEILTKYNLQMGDVIQAQDKDEQFDRQTATFEWNASWITQVYQSVAELYFCKMWSQPNGTTDCSVVLVGNTVNLYSAFYVAKILIDNGKRLAKEYAKHAYKEYGMNAVSASNNFKKGYALRIESRCRQMIKEAKAGHVKDAETGTALVLADFYERNKQQLDTYVAKELGVKLVSRGGMRGPGDEGAANAGRAAADKQNLRASGIGSSGEKTFLLGSK